jgi:hypothetical protein
METELWALHKNDAYGFYLNDYQIYSYKKER